MPKKENDKLFSFIIMDVHLFLKNKLNLAKYQKKNKLQLNLFILGM